MLVFSIIQVIILFFGIFLYKKSIEKINSTNIGYNDLKNQSDNYKTKLIELQTNEKNYINKIEELKISKLDLESLQQNYISKNSQLEEQNKNYININNKLEENNKKLLEDVEKLKYDNKYLEIKNKDLENRIEERGKSIASLTEMQDKIKLEFKSISSDVIQLQNKQFRENQENNLNLILKPLTNEIKEFKEKITVANKNTIETKSTIETKINDLISNTKNIQSSADNLAKALKGDKKAQGNWGETQLKNLLEIVGFEENKDYIYQYGIKDEENNKFFLDLVLNISNNKSLIIDSKASINNYNNYINSENETEKNICLNQFINDIKNHITELSNKEYSRVFKQYEKDTNKETIDTVFMFLSPESAYIEAIKYDDKLLDFASKNKIAIVTASSMMPVLNMIQHLWNIEKQNKNTEEIVDKAQKLYEKICNFTENLKKCGDKINEAKNAYENSLNLLTSGRGNALKIADDIKNLLGKNKTNKQLFLDFNNEEIIDD